MRSGSTPLERARECDRGGIVLELAGDREQLAGLTLAQAEVPVVEGQSVKTGRGVALCEGQEPESTVPPNPWASTRQGRRPSASANASVSPDM